MCFHFRSVSYGSKDHSNWYETIFWTYIAWGPQAKSLCNGRKRRKSQASPGKTHGPLLLGQHTNCRHVYEIGLGVSFLFCSTSRAGRENEIAGNYNSPSELPRSNSSRDFNLHLLLQTELHICAWSRPDLTFAQLALDSKYCIKAQILHWSPGFS